jgi:hypothetical protein
MSLSPSLRGPAAAEANLEPERGYGALRSTSAGEIVDAFSNTGTET